MKITIGNFLTITFGRPDHSPLEKIILIRHGESTGNTKEEDSRDVGDHNLRLSNMGNIQAQKAGEAHQKDLNQAIIYASPYRRTRETAQQFLIGANAPDKQIQVLEDPRLREVEHGYEDVAAQEEKRAVHGWFYYRFEGGESPADCYDRSSAALESIMRQATRKNKKCAIIFTHGLTIRCIIARFLHLKVEEFEDMANPQNCGIITIAKLKHLTNPLYKKGKWGKNLAQTLWNHQTIDT